MAERKMYLNTGNIHDKGKGDIPVYNPQHTLAISGCSYSFDRMIDEKGEPSHGLMGGSVAISFSGIPPEWAHQWLTRSNERINAEIVVKDPNTGTIACETLRLDNAACISFRFNYERTGSGYISCVFVLQAEFASMSGHTLDNRWTNQ